MLATTTTDTSGTFTGATGRTYCFSARARNDGVTGPYSSETCTAIPLDDRSLKLGSGWRQVTGSAFYRGAAVSSQPITDLALKRSSLFQCLRVALSSTKGVGLQEPKPEAGLDASVRCPLLHHADQVEGRGRISLPVELTNALNGGIKDAPWQARVRLKRFLD